MKDSPKLEWREIRTKSAIILIVISGLVMVSGIKVMGESEHLRDTADGPYVYWDPENLEWGIFITLVGALAVVFWLMVLTARGE